jgi:hypothetical protein
VEVCRSTGVFKTPKKIGSKRFITLIIGINKKKVFFIKFNLDGSDLG